MRSLPFVLVVTLIGAAAQAWPDDAAEVRATIEDHYRATNAHEESKALSDHLASFTMFPGDGGLLFEADWVQGQERVGQASPFPELNVRMTHFHTEVYGNVAVATFYLVGTQSADGVSAPINNRVSAVWIKQDGSWKEAHHHESQLLGRD